ncbi:MAG: hypothetical protein QOK40_2140 [Miltoncostaeaceae bacterium]|nr:hypothetical protein [Miltoncostaeaceae bacterium]
MSRQGQRGQAALELLAVLPALVALALVGWQLVAAAHVWLLADGAARAGAVAAAADADADRAVRDALPPGYRRVARVEVQRRAGRSTRVWVALRPPAPAPWLPDLGPVRADAPALP